MYEILFYGMLVGREEKKHSKSKIVSVGSLNYPPNLTHNKILRIHSNDNLDNLYIEIMSRQSAFRIQKISTDLLPENASR